MNGAVQLLTAALTQWASPRTAREIAAALMPVVDQIAATHSAAELREAADEVRGNHGTASLSAKRIDARAEALEVLAFGGAA